MSPVNATEIGQRRWYTWEGETLPSVTTILKYSLPKEWLGAWAAKKVAEYAVTLPDLLARYAADPEATLRDLKGAPWRVRDAAAARGSAVHEAAETHAPVEDVAENAQAAYRAYLGWEALYAPDVLVREAQVWSTSEGYGGSLDLICDLYGDRWIVDIKTGSYVGPEVRLQLAAYRFADFIGADDVGDDSATDTLRTVTRAAVLHLTDAGFSFIEVAAGWAEYERFLACKAVHDWGRETDRQAIGEIVLPQAKGEIA